METISKKELMSKLGAFVRVENAPSRNGYGSAPNQFILTFENGEVFQSYRSMVGIYMNGKYYFTQKHDCSNTTCGHVKRWCNMTAQERRNALQCGSAVLVEE